MSTTEENRSTANTAGSGNEAVLKSLVDKAVASAAMMAEQAGQTGMIRFQTTALCDAVERLGTTLTGQSQRIAALEHVLNTDVRRAQAALGRQALSGVFQKLFRELAGHVGQLDDLLATADAAPRGENETPWISAIRAARDGLESTLGEWGCRPIPVDVGRQPFDPHIHEAVPGEIHTGEMLDGGIPEIGADVGDNVVLSVRRRGWKWDETVLSHPQVVVS